MITKMIQKTRYVLISTTNCKLKRFKTEMTNYSPNKLFSSVLNFIYLDRSPLVLGIMGVCPVLRTFEA